MTLPLDVTPLFREGGVTVEDVKRLCKKDRFDRVWYHRYKRVSFDPRKEDHINDSESMPMLLDKTYNARVGLRDDDEKTRWCFRIRAWCMSRQMY